MLNACVVQNLANTFVLWIHERIVRENFCRTLPIPRAERILQGAVIFQQRLALSAQHREFPGDRGGEGCEAVEAALEHLADQFGGLIDSLRFELHRRHVRYRAAAADSLKIFAYVRLALGGHGHGK